MAWDGQDTDARHHAVGLPEVAIRDCDGFQLRSDVLPPNQGPRDLRLFPARRCGTLQDLLRCMQGLSQVGPARAGCFAPQDLDRTAGMSQGI